MSFSPSVFILGAGAIGTAFAATMRAAGWDVTLYDALADARTNAIGAVERHDASLRRAGHAVVEHLRQIDIVSDIPCTTEFALAIEAGPERVAIKSEIFRQLIDRLTGETIIATTSSAIPISDILPDRQDQSRCIVAHPGNPPSLIRVLELVPAPGTLPSTMERAEMLFQSAGFDPIPLAREVSGFVFNRLQSALLREAYRLVDEGVVDVEGIDRLVRDGLGPRWALSGPFETADLNTVGGIRGHAERMGPAYAAIGEARGEHKARWSAELVALVEAQRRAILHADDLPRRRAWREIALADLLAARRDLLSRNRSE